jgi:hypothetical protein
LNERDLTFETFKLKFAASGLRSIPHVLPRYVDKAKAIQSIYAASKHKIHTAA